MKKFFVAVLMLLTIPVFATGVGPGAATADCDNATLNTFSGTSNLSANWQANTIDLHWYNDDTEITSGVPTSCIYDGDLTPPSTIPTKTGYTFKGWKTKKIFVPDGYTQLEYIENTGTAYINTGISFVYDTDVGYCKTKIAFTEEFSSMGANGGILLNGRDGYFSVPGITGGYAYTLDTAYHIVFGINSNHNRYLTIRGITYEGRAASLTNSIHIFHVGGAGSHSKGKVYNFSIVKNDVLVRNLIPAKRNSDNVLGMWDTVTKTFFTGTGTFTAGPVVQ
ncbi:MAG: InlB B-repeat-containing protein [Alphaproteobacteria bacterium]|nr:InlB B-repeat-containing protein [Alphaproteobacteria bacterium]